MTTHRWRSGSANNKSFRQVEESAVIERDFKWVVDVEDDGPQHGLQSRFSRAAYCFYH